MTCVGDHVHFAKPEKDPPMHRLTAWSWRSMLANGKSRGIAAALTAGTARTARTAVIDPVIVVSSRSQALRGPR